MTLLLVSAMLFAVLPEGSPMEIEPVFLTEGVLFADVLSDSELLCIRTEEGVVSPAILHLDTGLFTPWQIGWEPEHHGWFMNGYRGLGVSSDGQHVFIAMGASVPGEFDHGYSNTDLIILVVSSRDGTGAAPVALGMEPVGNGRTALHFTPDSRHIVGNNILAEYMYPEAYASHLIDTEGHFPLNRHINAYCLESGTPVLISFSRKEDPWYSLGPSADYSPSASGRYFATRHTDPDALALSFGDWVEGSAPGEETVIEDASSVGGWLGDIGLAVSTSRGSLIASPDGTLRELPPGFDPRTARMLFDGTWLFTGMENSDLKHGILDGNTLQILAGDTITMEGLSRSPIILPLPGSGAVVISGTGPYQLWHLRAVL